jgi:AbrB family looped-hinge helix DNA binding protein
MRIIISMEQIVTITSQGQLTIPRSVRKAFGIKGSTKAVLRSTGKTIIVEPKGDFWSLSGSLKSSVTLTDSQLRKTRDKFAKKWPRKI